MIRVAAIDELPPGAKRMVQAGQRVIGVYNVGGTYVAVLNACPHELAPICLGRVDGTTLVSKPGEWRWGREGEILVCPWHGWEFDLLNGGRCLTDPRALRTYPVEVRDGAVWVVG